MTLTQAADWIGHVFNRMVHHDTVETIAVIPLVAQRPQPNISAALPGKLNRRRIRIDSFSLPAAALDRQDEVTVAAADIQNPARLLLRQAGNERRKGKAGNRA
ncbi:MAG: hypothetical protein ABSG11_09215 [Candidatus Korobacteraceae bacterium]